MHLLHRYRKVFLLMSFNGENICNLWNPLKVTSWLNVFRCWVRLSKNKYILYFYSLLWVLWGFLNVFVIVVSYTKFQKFDMKFELDIVKALKIWIAKSQKNYVHTNSVHRLQIIFWVNILKIVDPTLVVDVFDIDLICIYFDCVPFISWLSNNHEAIISSTD